MQNLREPLGEETVTVDFNEGGAEEAVIELDGQGLGKGFAERRLACAWMACNNENEKKLRAIGIFRK